MQSNQKKMISEFVKEARLAKGYTQKELSELSNVSVRSIQRIENGEILPRSYTLKTLAGILGLSFEELQSSFNSKEPSTNNFNQKNSFMINRTQKLILSVASSLIVILLALAFVAQSPRFPETHFETILFAVLILLILSALLVIIWRTRS